MGPSGAFEFSPRVTGHRYDRRGHSAALAGKELGGELLELGVDGVVWFGLGREGSVHPVLRQLQVVDISFGLDGQIRHPQRLVEGADGQTLAGNNRRCFDIAGNQIQLGESAGDIDDRLYG